MPHFAECLKQLRIKKGISQKKLADFLHVSQNAVFQWEKEKCEPSIEMLKKIAEYFNVSMDYLMGLEESDDIVLNHNLNGLPDILDGYTHELGEFLYYNPHHKALFDASMEVKPSDVDFAKQMLDRINGKTGD